jgi:hypothetical protein
MKGIPGGEDQGRPLDSRRIPHNQLKRGIGAFMSQEKEQGKGKAEEELY